MLHFVVIDPYANTSFNERELVSSCFLLLLNYAVFMHYKLLHLNGEDI